MSDLQETVSLHALDLFERKGYAQTAVTEIIEAVPIARRTFFRHFEGKDDTVLKPHRLRFSTFSSALARPYPGLPLEHLLASIDQAFASMWQEPEMHRRRYRLIFETPELLAQMTVSDGAYIELAASHLRPAFTKHSMLPDMLAHAGMGAVNRMLRSFAAGGSIKSCAAALNQMKDHLRHFAEGEAIPSPNSTLVITTTAASADEVVRALTVAGLVRSSR